MDKIKHPSFIVIKKNIFIVHLKNNPKQVESDKTVMDLNY